MDDYLKTFVGNQVRIHRRKAALNQADLGNLIERSADTISNIETGKALPSVDTLLALAASLQITVLDLIPVEREPRDISKVRLSKEGEAIETLRHLPDNKLDAALLQLKALADL